MIPLTTRLFSHWSIPLSIVWNFVPPLSPLQASVPPAPNLGPGVDETHLLVREGLGTQFIRLGRNSGTLYSSIGDPDPSIIKQK